MNIVIIGEGVIGTAWGKVLEEFGYNVRFIDKGDNYEKLINTDIVFICTPEMVVYEVVKSINFINKNIPIVCRSTCIPGTADEVSEQIENEYYVMPEFLKERNAFDTALRPDRIVIGAKDKICVYLDEILQNFYCPIYKVSYKEAESIKLIANNLLSLIISFWNEMYLAGLATQNVAKIVCEDKTLKSCYRIFGKAYGGKCFPKDVAQMLKYLQNKGNAFLNITAANKYINDIMEYKYGISTLSLEELLREDKTDEL